jgi:uncharacterized membrane protein
MDYEGLADAMFHMIRHTAAGSTAAFIRMLDLLTAVVSFERRRDRYATLARHAKLVVDHGRRSIANSADPRDLMGRCARFDEVRAGRVV